MDYKTKGNDRAHPWTLGLYAVFLLVTSSVHAGIIVMPDDPDEGPDPSTVSIKSIAYAGTGCPAGTVSESLAPDAKAFTLLFDSYVVEAGPGVPLRESRKNCQLAVDLRFPQGWSFTIVDVDYRGYASIDRGATGTQKTNYYFQGQRVGPSLQTTMRGPFDDDYHIRDKLGVDAVVYSPCGLSRALNLNTQIRVQARGSSQALMTIDSIDGELTHVYGLKWRRCR
ncbi:MAG: DUF4360 domain-containing protein [Bdellovibrionales bacterium]|nr:DUF4360 domain-containing protein [Bdellovibrionales bacterium]